MYRKVIKRFLDIILSLLGIIVLSPVYLVLFIFVRIKLGTPVLFSQERPGRNEKIFKLYKFRTMTNKVDEDGNLLPDEKRLTKFGRLLRSTSLDELPELFNILKGDMSLIGPRPLLVRYLPFYSKDEHHRHDVRPGLTGLAQINGRNALGWEDRFRLDLEYVNELSFLMDMKVLIKTIGKVLKKSDTLSGEDQVIADLDVERANHNQEIFNEENRIV